jgi:hypothetical protein
MSLTLTRTFTADEREALEAAQARSRSVRQWRRYQDCVVAADGMPVATVGQSLTCTKTRVYN